MIMTLLMVLGIAAIALGSLGLCARVTHGPGLRSKSAPRYCTKHVIVQLGPGGPDQVRWVYGPHRTRGNDCDGPEHRRSSWWW
jgi:hypothetical protein